MNDNPVLRGQDFINGKYGRAFADIEGSRYDLFNVTNVEFSANNSIKALQVLDSHLDKHLETGAEGKFSGEMYRASPMFQKIFFEKKGTLKTIRFDMEIVEHDPNYEGGKQIMVYKDCLLDKYTLSKLDISNTELRQDFSGTFDDVLTSQEYQVLQGMVR